MGSFLIMGLFGIIIASLVNIFLKSSGLDCDRSRSIGVLRVRGPHRLGHPEDQGDVRLEGRRQRHGRKAVMGALSLYLDFINLFLMLLRLVGDRR